MSLCDFPVRTRVFKGYGNITTVTPDADIDMATATRVVMCFTGVSAASDAVTPHVWFAEVAGVWTITAKIGMFTGLQDGEYDVAVVVYTAANADGIVLQDLIPIEVVTVC